MYLKTLGEKNKQNTGKYCKPFYSFQLKIKRVERKQDLSSTLGLSADDKQKQ